MLPAKLAGIKDREIEESGCCGEVLAKKNRRATAQSC